MFCSYSTVSTCQNLNVVILRSIKLHITKPKLSMCWSAFSEHTYYAEMVPYVWIVSYYTGSSSERLALPKECSPTSKKVRGPKFTPQTQMQVLLLIWTAGFHWSFINKIYLCRQIHMGNIFIETESKIRTATVNQWSHNSVPYLKDQDPEL